MSICIPTPDFSKAGDAAIAVIHDVSHWSAALTDADVASFLLTILIVAAELAVAVVIGFAVVEVARFVFRPIGKAAGWLAARLP